MDFHFHYSSHMWRRLFFGIYLLLIEIQGNEAAVAETGLYNGEVITEVTYEKPIGDLHSTQISEKGDSLEIGSRPNREIGNPEVVVECVKNLNVDDYKSEYKTVVYNRSSHLYRVLESESEPSKMDELLYFIYVKKDLWSCTNKTQQLSFLRVVNELLGIREIRGIRYHDGIEISTKHYLGTRKTAKVKEVKYFLKNEAETIPVRYVGKLKELKPVDDHGILGLAAKADASTLAQSTDGLFRELNTRPTQPITLDLESTTGITLIMKYAYNKASANSIGNKDSKAGCVQDHGIHPMPKQFQLDFVQVISKYDTTFEAEIFPEHKSKYFIPIFQEIWFCQMEEGRLFIRVVNEAICRKEVKQVSIHEGVTNVYKIKMGESKLTVRVRDVRYFDAITNAEIFYNGKIALKKDAATPPPKKYAGEIPYALSDNRLFKRLISSEGYDIRVGEKWLTTIEPASDKGVECYMIPRKYKYSETYRMKFRLKVHSTDENKRATYTIETITGDKLQKFIVFVMGEVSVCYDAGSNTVKRFLRIYNQMEVLVPVHEIEFHDGVFVFDTTVNMKTRSVKLVEIKYLELITHRMIKYEGKVTLKGSTTNGSPTELKDANTAMKLTSDDIFWRVGRFTNMNVDLVNLNSYIEEHPSFSGTMDYNPRGKYQMRFGTNNERVTLGSRTDTAECKLTGRGTYIPLRMIDRGGGRATRIYFGEFPKYFHSRERKVWDCQVPWSEKPLIQLDDDQTLADQIPSPYQDNIYEFKWDKGRYSSANFIMINDRCHLNVKMTNFFTIEGKEYNEVVFDGHMLYAGGKQGPKESGTILLEEDEEKIETRLQYLTREIEFKVGRAWEYHSKLSDEGVSLFIGQKTTGIFGNSSTVVKCIKMDMGKIDGGLFDTFYRTRVKDDPKGRYTSRKSSKHNQVLFNEYFQSIENEVWACEDDGKRILRVLNHFYINQGKCRSVKEVLYFDGVTILLGPNPIQHHPDSDNNVCTEIVEIKYMDPEDHSLVLKFEGKVELMGKNGELLRNEITTARKLTRVAKLEVSYLPQQQVLKAPINDKGLVLEIGVENTETYNIPRLNCRINNGDLPHFRMKYKPVIVINEKGSDSEIKQETLNIDDIHNHFTYTMSLWDCEDERNKNEKFLRVVNTLKVKNADRKINIATIFYYDGVDIHTDPELIIREIKFYKGQDKAKTVRVVGFTYLDGVEATSEEAKATKEIFYNLDTSRLHVKKTGSDIGPIIEIGSQIVKTFGSENDAVLCKRDKNHIYNEKYKTLMFGNFEGRMNMDRKIALDDDTVKKYFQILKQELWKCSKNEEEAFIRIVNVYVALKSVSRIFHPDGVVIGTQVFPDNAKDTQIKEIKYLDPKTLEPLMYEGKITLEAIFSNKATTLFQLPSKYQDYEITQLEPHQVNAHDMKHWSLDILVIHALRQHATDQTLEGVTYGNEKKAELQQRTATVIEGAHGIKVEVGSKYDALFVSKSGMKCMLDQWNPTDTKRFLTKIKLHVDDEFYVLDSETIQEYFDVKSIEVWICVNNDHSLLRVVTQLVGIKDIYMVIRFHGVEFNKIELKNGGSSVSITEIKYMDTRDFKVLKYEGELKMIEKKKPPTTTEISLSGGANTDNANKNNAGTAVEYSTEIPSPPRSSVFTIFASWGKKFWESLNNIK